jgi:phenylpropionate dioxygenase-like ring-hydroxylating dioxygenase large terminal subunit
MMSAEQNERVTRVGPGTPCGTLQRLYWQPVALSEELPAERSLRTVRVLGQDLVLFRDERGRLGLLDRDCAHRGADLAFGRLEDGGLRCAFHGWLYDVTGRCLETPAEPEGSRLCDRVRQRAYAVREQNGVIFAYLGPGEPPALPRLDCFAAPAEYSFAFKGHIDCNWLQALEVGIDPAHASFLHRFFEDEDPNAGYGKQFRANSIDSEMPMSRVLREYDRPRIDVENTDYGLRLIALRTLDPARIHVRVTNLIFPHAVLIPLSETMTITQWHVPVDDAQCYWYAIFTSFHDPIDRDEMRRQRLQLYELPDYKPRLNRANDWGYSAAEQKSQTFTGMGHDINVHDNWAVESQGRIHDRTREHLGQTDKAISAYRRVLVDAIAQATAGETPLLARSGGHELPITVDGIASSNAWDDYWREADAKRRRASPWQTP